MLLILVFEISIALSKRDECLFDEYSIFVAKTNLKILQILSSFDFSFYNTKFSKSKLVMIIRIIVFIIWHESFQINSVPIHI